MIKKSFLFSLILSFLLFLAVTVSTVSAETVAPNFPSCVNPQGNLKVNYPTGMHGVVGTATLYSGADTVYSISENTVMQCLCPDSGEGIQTNWWKIPELSGNEIENYKTQGWIFVPDGSIWGLDPAAYLAKNLNFSCRSTNSSNNNNSNSNSNSNTSSSSIGGVASIGDILALAATGNIKTIYGLFFLGLISMLFGYLLNRRNG